MDLIYINMTDAIKVIEDRLKNMTLAYKLVESKNVDLPALVDGNKSYIGYYKMHQYIDLLDREKEKWYYCDC